MPGFIADALSRPENRVYYEAIDTALMWGREPMDILIPVHTRYRYPDLDLEAIADANIAMMRGWTKLKRESCPKCGTPYWIGHNPDNNIQFGVEEDTCYACKATEEHDAMKAKDKASNQHGVVTYPVLKMMFDTPRPTRVIGLQRMAGMAVEP